ncbi:MAG: hypothetical protein Tsb0014_14680 [Pleurocapsa sp.]
MPDSSDVGIYNVKVIATDNSGATAEDIFSLNVETLSKFYLTQTLKLQAVKFDDEDINLNLKNSTQVKNSTQLIAKPGDITADGHLNDSDIYSISRLAVGLDTDVDSFSGIEPSLIADMNQDGVISAFDAYLAYTAMD